MLSDHVKELVRLAVAEDLGTGDLTTDALIPPSMNARARIVVKEDVVVCGHELSAAVFAAIDPNLRYDVICPDGSVVAAGTEIARVGGAFGSILKGERVALNFLQHLTGIALRTHRVVAKLKGSEVRVLDTRKTTPGWRELEKYAVKTGGGQNHRLGLYDAILIKNNHLDALKGDLVAAVSKCREYLKSRKSSAMVQVEVRNDQELALAITARPDGVLLDNMNSEKIASCVKRLRAELGAGLMIEASGGITELTIESFNIPGLTAVSIGALTHSVRAADMSLYFESYLT